MNRKTANRRTAAMAEKVAALWGKRLNVHDPEFNIREMAKQLALLEEHFFHPGKLCPDCIRKHLMTVEALADETVSLAVARPGEETVAWDDLEIQTIPEGARVPMHEIHRLVGRNLSELAKRWIEQFNEAKRVEDIGEEVRQVRKRLVKCVPDPRREFAAAMVSARKISACKHQRAESSALSEMKRGVSADPEGWEILVKARVPEPEDSRIDPEMMREPFTF